MIQSQWGLEPDGECSSAAPSNSMLQIPRVTFSHTSQLSIQKSHTEATRVPSSTKPKGAHFSLYSHELKAVQLFRQINAHKQKRPRDSKGSDPTSEESVYHRLKGGLELFPNELVLFSAFPSAQHKAAPTALRTCTREASASPLLLQFFLQTEWMPLTDVQQSACVTASWFSLQANDQRVSKALLVDIVLTYVRTGKLSFETASVWLSNVLRRWIKTFEASNGCTAEDHSVSPTTTVHTVERDQLLEEVSDVAAACVFALQSAERFGEETDDDKVPWPYFAFSVLTHLVIDITRVLKELSTTDATLFRWQYAYVRLLLQVGFAIKTDPRLTVPPDVTSTSQTENSFTGPFVLSKLKQQWSMLPAQLCHHTHAINYLCPSDIVVLDFLLL